MSEPDYNNDLAFEPKITFHDLCAWAKAQNYPGVSVEDEFKGGEAIFIGNEYNFLEFDITGIVTVNGDIIAMGVSPSRVKTIIEALYENS